MSSLTTAWRSSSRNATLHNPITGCDWPPEDATASCASCSIRARCSRATRSRGRNGQSAAALRIHPTSGRFAAVQSSAARMPARGPGKSCTVSAITGNPNAANRAGSPLALRMSPSHCAASRAMTRSRMVRPPMLRIGLSPPPIRRASPPASRTPGVAGISVIPLALAHMASGFLCDIIEILVVNDALLAGQRNEPFSPCPSDQRQADLPREVDAPRRKSRTRDQDRNPHPDGLDHHLGGEPSGGVEDLVGGIHVVPEHPARDLVDGVVAADVFGVADRRALLAQYAAVDRAGLEIERRHGVDRMRHLIEPGRPQFG